MRAAVLREVGGKMPVEELTLRPLASHEVRVRIAACGVCHSDLSVQQGVMPVMFPSVLGHEGAGTVEEVGDAVASVAPGDQVIMAPIAPCRRCFFCLRGQPTLCEQGFNHMFTPYAHAGDEAIGPGLGPAAFGEETIVPEASVVPIDASFPIEIAALVGCGVVTGVGSVVNSAQVEAGATVAVIGCGGVGLAAIQGARLSGASQIIAVDRVAGRLEHATGSGATATVDASGSDPVAAVRELTDGRGVDYSFEVVGLSSTIQQAYDLARRGGTVTVVGAGSFDDMVSFSAANLMVDARTVRGCVFGSTDPLRDFPRIVRWQEQGLLDLERLVTRRIGLDDIDDAFREMLEGKGARSVVILGG
ncbi:MAG TPA: Zn-dependent alcohol dehydrogenase [Acidimicrobiia bacterium]